MTLNERRPHWKIGAVEGEQDESGARVLDPDARRYACFTVSEHAAEWLIEQLAKHTVEDLGGFNRACDWHDWALRQGTQDEEADAGQRHDSQGGSYHVISAEIGGVEYRMEVCTCTGEVTGRCHNQGCDRDVDYDTEPGYGEGSYSRWSTTCYRCGFRTHARGGYIGQDPQPLPAHHHDEGQVQVAKLIEADEWVGWRCAASDEDTSGCGALWLFDDADAWASQYRLTRMWDDNVTGTEGYAMTEEAARDEAERLTAESVLHNRGYTVGYEKIQHKKEQS